MNSVCFILTVVAHTTHFGATCFSSSYGSFTLTRTILIISARKDRCQPLVHCLCTYSVYIN